MKAFIKKLLDTHKGFILFILGVSFFITGKILVSSEEPEILFFWCEVSFIGTLMFYNIFNLCVFGIYDDNYAKRKPDEDFVKYDKAKRKYLYDGKKAALKNYTSKQIRDDLKRRDEEGFYSLCLVPISIVSYYFAYLCVSNSLEFARLKIIQIITDIINSLFVPPVTAIGTTMLIVAFIVLFKNHSRSNLSKK